jgi:diguanylate cyclase (GGDEF)-like protein
MPLRSRIKTALQSRSLRTRYGAAALLLAVFVLATALVAHQRFSAASRESAANLESRHGLVEATRRIRVEIFDAYRALDGFLLVPGRLELRDAVHDAIARALALSADLEGHPWIIANGEQGTVAELTSGLKKLDSASTDLFTTRLDVTLQYPSLGLSNRTLRPSRNGVDSAFLVAMQTLHMTDDHSPRDILDDFVHARHLWAQMVSDFRLYLANRVGSFNEEALETQEKSIDTIYEVLAAQLAALKQRDEAGELSFEVSIALDEITANAARWYGGFQEVKRIHHSGDWRADVTLIKTTIEPQLAHIAGLLRSLELDIDSSADQNLKLLTSTARSQITVLWIAAVVGLLFIGAAFGFIDRLLLRPIATVAGALKAKAIGRDDVMLPNPTSPEIHRLIDAFNEMRQQVRSRETALEHQALHDALTGLPNRALLTDRIEQAIRAARRDSSPLALLIIDLDRFKEVNDTLGHLVGDQLLTQVGERLSEALRQVDTIARLGGDEFAILLPGVDTEQACAVAQKLLAALEAEHQLDELRLYSAGSIGIAMYPEHGTEAQTLIQRADVAMYIAKRGQRGMAVYNAEEDLHSISRLALVADLRRALDEDGLSLHYQPKLELATGRVIGVEALLRWQHPEYGAIPPDQAVELAEQTGLIQRLTLWVIDRAVRQCAEWGLHGLDLEVAVNLSMYNLRNNEIVDTVRESTARHDLPPRRLAMEITENAMMSNPAAAVEVLSSLDAMGVRLAVDDFGTGFSSLAYLKRLPVDELKIDKSFVTDLTRNENDLLIVRSTIELAHNLGLTVVAEGVEDAPTWERLKTLNCDAAQGYYMSRPQEPNALARWLKERSAA